MIRGFIGRLHPRRAHPVGGHPLHPQQMTTVRRLWCRLVGHDVRPPTLYGSRRIIYRCQRCGLEANLGPDFST